MRGNVCDEWRWAINALIGSQVVLALRRRPSYDAKEKLCSLLAGFLLLVGVEQGALFSRARLWWWSEFRLHAPIALAQNRAHYSLVSGCGGGGGPDLDCMLRSFSR